MSDEAAVKRVGCGLFIAYREKVKLMEPSHG
jgi:hypothetical protein